MSTREIVVPTFALLAVILFTSLFLVPKAIATVACTDPGDVLITDASRPAATAAGIPQNVLCWNPDDAIVGQKIGEAKQYLLSIARGLPGTQAPPDQAHIERLNNTFAVCAAGFFKAYTQAYGPVAISSAYRDGPSGENARAGGAPNSNHTRGLAMDVNPAGGQSSYETMWQFASQNPKFGVCFPHQTGDKSYTTSYPDKPHMILAGIGGNEAAACARQGVTKPCGVLITSNEEPTPPPLIADTEILPPPFYNFSGSAPADSGLDLGLGIKIPEISPAEIMKLLRSLLGGSDAKTEDGSGTQTQTPQFCEPKFSCTGNVLYYNTSSCVKQVYEPCSYGCATSGIACAAQPQTTTNNTVTPTPDLTPVSNNIDPTLNPSTSDIAMLWAPPPEATQASGTIVLLQPIYTSPQTFTSGDLTNNPSPAFVAQQEQNGFFFQILTSMRNTLVSVLNYLRPFGGNLPM